MSIGLSSRRYHAFDQLRAAMMLLGLVLHAAASYSKYPLGGAWPHQDASTSVVLHALVAVIHLFRMPVFFMMAGFFGALLYYRRGAAEMMKNRARRILLPLAAAWPLLFPLTGLGFLFAVSGGWEEALGMLSRGHPDTGAFGLNLLHLWFLYDLLLLYAAALLVVRCLHRLPGSRRARAATRIARLFTTGRAPWVFSIVTAATLLPMSYPGFDTSGALVPPLRILVAYGVFFGAGWLIYTRRELVVDAFPTHVARHTIVAALASGAYVLVLRHPPVGAHLLGATLAAVASWHALFAVTGLFVRFLDRPSPVGRYLSDASYWIYLVHLPITVWMVGLLGGFSWPAGVKFAVVLTTTFVASLVTYHLFVRTTLLGAFLNGHRHPRALPRPAPAGEEPAPRIRVAA